MKHFNLIFTALICIFYCSSCHQDIQITHTLEESSPVDTMYNGIVIPPNIAPLNFFLPDNGKEQAVVLESNGIKLTAIAENNTAIPALREWKDLLEQAKTHISVTHCYRTDNGWIAYPPFTLTIAEESIDPYLAYRLIPPGYEMWYKMGIYQRNLENFEETAIITNERMEHNCVNCHTFPKQNPEKMTLHTRLRHGGTLIMQGDEVKKLSFENIPVKGLVYPFWHPTEKFIAYSVNDTKQFFHTNHQNRIEVLDLESNVVVYDVDRNELLTSPPLFQDSIYETFPVFTPDGKNLVYCAAHHQEMPSGHNKVKYNLMSVSFDAENRRLGTKPDTLFHAEALGKSASFPRISPDGKHLLFTLSEYGNFSIWHQDADLWMLDLQTLQAEPLDAINSNSVESYHTWSSNGSWIVFSSRRGDGLYTRPYIAYIDKQGKVYKPFVLPQATSDHYQNQLYSYNLPEFITGPVTNGDAILEQVLSDETTVVNQLKGNTVQSHH